MTYRRSNCTTGAPTKERYYAACERSRIQVDHGPLAELIAEWQDRAQEQSEAENGL